MKLLIIILGIYLVNEGWAGPDRQLGRSPRGLLMGDAYTALADDEFTLYYNPAILARHKGFTFSPINPRFTLVNALKDADRFSDMGSTSAEMADAIMDYPIHLGLSAAPGFKMGRFGLTAIVNQETNFRLMNQTTPMLDIDHRYDKGFIMGYARPLTGDLAFGMSVKYLQRESLYGTYNLLGTSMQDSIGQGDMFDIINSLGMVNGSGWGVDFGLDYVIQNGPNRFTMGLALLDIYTLLHTNSNPYDVEVQPQPMQLNFGTSYALEAAGFGLIFSADIRNLNQQMELMRRVRLGTEVKMSPALSLLAGMSSGGYSYGIKLNMGLLKLYTGFFDEDIGEKLNQQRSSRALIYLSLFDFTFEG
jgi:hypothetical protein